MRKVFKFLVAIIVIAIVFLIGCLVWNNYLQPVEVPDLLSDSVEFGSVVNKEEGEKNYEAYIQKLDADELIALDVNSYIDNQLAEFKKENETTDRVAPKDKAVYKNVIDTYKANDNIASVKITSIIKKVQEEKYNTTIKTFNYDVKEGKSISLDDIFKSGYERVLSSVYTENYVFKQKVIQFFSSTNTNNCTYNSLKEYASSKVLTASNYDISQEEYELLFSNVVDKNKKMVAITLDDGPHATNTQKILDILDAHNAKATFFMLGQNVVNNEEVVKDVYKRGNEIGIHTWDHKQLTKLSQDEIVSQVERTSDAIYKIIGKRPKLVRPPYGAINDTVKNSINYSLILWNIDSLDWKSRDEKQIVPLVMNSVQDGDIILLHDIHSTTVPAVEKIVSQLEEQGYQMVTVSQLLEAKGYDTSKTKVFYSGRQ
mgnify:CR=1 FL=1